MKDNRTFIAPGLINPKVFGDNAEAVTAALIEQGVIQVCNPVVKESCAEEHVANNGSYGDSVAEEITEHIRNGAAIE